MSTRDEAGFSPSTKRVIASAVNWQCSAPLCKNPAMGADDGTTINGGTACHIFSAAENGPRGRGGLTEEQLADASNGLWCCAYHGRVIDANQGSSFPAAQLHMWKRLAEGRVLRATAVKYAELGWIHRFSLSVETYPGVHWTTSGILQKNNLLSAKSGAGKSLLLEALGTISDGRHAQRLRQFPGFSVDLEYETLTRETVAQVSSSVGQSLHRKLGGFGAVLGPADMAVLYLTPDLTRRPGDYSGIPRLMQLLGVDEDVLEAIAGSVSVSPDAGMSITFKPHEPDELESANDDGQGRNAAFVKLEHKGIELPINGLSGSEQIRVASALLIALARNQAKTRPVLLCIDALWQLDDKVFRHELGRLAEEHLQLLVVTPYEVSQERASRDFPGWNFLRMPSIEGKLIPPGSR